MGITGSLFALMKYNKLLQCGVDFVGICRGPRSNFSILQPVVVVWRRGRGAHTDQRRILRQYFSPHRYFAVLVPIMAQNGP